MFMKKKKKYKQILNTHKRGLDQRDTKHMTSPLSLSFSLSLYIYIMLMKNKTKKKSSR